MNEQITATGKVVIKLYGPDGVLKDERIGPNLVVTAGKNYLAAWLAAASQAGKFMEYVGVGTGSTSPVVGNTALETELTRIAGTITSSTNVWSNAASFGPGVGTGSITEAGLFSASSSGTMFARQTFPVVTKGALDTIAFNWSVTFS